MKAPKTNPGSAPLAERCGPPLPAAVCGEAALPSTISHQPSTTSQLPPLSRGPGKVRAQLGVQVAVGSSNREAGPGGGNCLDFVASTGALDRYGEILEPRGWKLDAYLANPVFQNAHRYGDVLFTLGRASRVAVETLPNGRDALCMRVEFATEVNPVARVAYGLYQGGFLNAVSVGFIPLEWQNGTEQDDFYRKYLSQELVEVSAVAVPANREALKLGLAEGAITRATLQEAIDVLSATLSTEQEHGPKTFTEGNKANEGGGVSEGSRLLWPGRLGETALPRNHQPATTNQLLFWGRELRAAMGA